MYFCRLLIICIPEQRPECGEPMRSRENEKNVFTRLSNGADLPPTGNVKSRRPTAYPVSELGLDSGFDYRCLVTVNDIVDITRRQNSAH